MLYGKGISLVYQSPGFCNTDITDAANWEVYCMRIHILFQPGSSSLRYPFHLTRSEQMNSIMYVFQVLASVSKLYRHMSFWILSSYWDHKLSFQSGIRLNICILMILSAWQTDLTPPPLSYYYLRHTDI